MRVPTLLLVILASAVTVTAPTRAWSQSLERTVYASVVNHAGTPVDNLGAADFVVKEDGEVRGVLAVSAADDPVDIAVLVNAGEGKIGDIRRGLADLFHEIHARHQMALTGLARPAVRVDYTEDADTFLRGVNTLYLRGVNGAYTSMRAAVLDASRVLRKRATSRRAIIVVSDGTYRRAADTRNDLLAALRGSGTTLYEVVIAASQPPYAYPNGSYYIKPPVSVNNLVPQASGGRVVYVLASTGVPTALAGIASDINHQYRVNYTRPTTAAALESVEVTVRRPGMTVRATRVPPE